MNEIIKINWENVDRPTVSGRELHEALEVKTKYADWFKRMCEYGFTDGEDFTCFSNLGSENQHGGQNRVDHQLTIPMAKEICMLQRSEKGKQCRQYFIKIEEMWNTPEMIMSRAIQISNKRIIELETQIAQDKPLVDFANQIQTSDDCIDMRDMAHLLAKNEINIGRTRLFTFLRKHKVLDMKNKPYQRYIEQQPWFQVKEYTYCKGDEVCIGTITLVTPKGQIGITNLIKKKYIDSSGG